MYYVKVLPHERETISFMARSATCKRRHASIAGRLKEHGVFFYIESIILSKNMSRFQFLGKKEETANLLLYKGKIVLIINIE